MTILVVGQVGNLRPIGNRPTANSQQTPLAKRQLNPHTSAAARRAKRLSGSAKRVLLLLVALTARAADSLPSTSLDMILTLGKGVAIDCPKGVIRVATSSPEIVDAVAASSQEVLF